MTPTDKTEVLMRLHHVAVDRSHAGGHNEADEAEDALRAAIEQALREARAVPDGYVLAPKKPTMAMLNTWAHRWPIVYYGDQRCTEKILGWGQVNDIWNDMLAAAPAQPAAEPAGITLTVGIVFPNFGDAYAHDQAGKRYMLNTGTAGITFASLKPGMRLTAQVNERNYVVSAKVEGE